MKQLTTIALFLGLILTVNANETSNFEELLKNQRPSDLPGIAKNLSAIGSTMQIKGDYTGALTNYKKSLQIRKSLGLEKTQGYANVLFLSSIAEHKIGNSCKAMSNMKKVIEIYNYLGLNDEANQAEAEGLKEFKTACETLVSQN